MKAKTCPQWMKWLLDSESRPQSGRYGAGPDLARRFTLGFARESASCYHHRHHGRAIWGIPEDTASSPYSSINLRASARMALRTQMATLMLRTSGHLENVGLRSCRIWTIELAIAVRSIMNRACLVGDLPKKIRVPLL